VKLRTILALSMATAVVAGGVPVATAKGRRAIIKCRDVTGSGVMRMERNAFGAIDRCYDHAPRAAHCTSLSALDVSKDDKSLFGRTTARVVGVIGYWCGLPGVGATITENYPTGSSVFMGNVTKNLQQTLQESPITLQGMAAFAEGGAAAKKRRCIRGIGRARTSIANGVLAATVRCQRKVDRHATAFGLVAAKCLGNPTRAAARKASRTVERACGALTGAEVGSCDPLPGCLVDSATNTAHDLATTAYGSKPDQRGSLCGNGQIDPGEDCDDGPANSVHGACTDTCRKAACGDGKVETGVEDCDNGKNALGKNFDSPTCTAACKASSCGDGIVQQGEQCDNGPLNGTPGNPCAATCEYVPVTCPSSGTIDLNVTLVPTVQTFSSNLVQGLEVDVGYPTAISIPGTGFLDVGDPADPATRIVLLSTDPNGVNLYDGLVTFFDVDTAPQQIADHTLSPPALATLLTLNQSAKLIFSAKVPFERIRFDCSAGTQVTEADFTCTVTDVTDLQGHNHPSDEFPECALAIPR
jgi:cysteine-rich repeat protein